MKKQIFLLATVFLFSLLNSCSEDYDSISSENELKTSSLKIHQLIVDYYDNDFSIGKSITIEGQNVKFTSLNSNYQKSPIGYMITNLTTNELYTFIDVNIAKNRVKVIDLKEDRSTVSNSFFEDNNLNKNKDFDLIKIIEESIENNQSSRKFWGWDCHAGSCSTCIECCYYVFGINTGCNDVDFDLHGY